MDDISSKKNSKGIWSPDKVSESSHDGFSDKECQIFETDSANDQESFINEYEKNS